MYAVFIFFVIVLLKFLLNLLRLIGTHICYHSFKKQSKNIDTLIPFVESLFNSAKTNFVTIVQSRKVDIQEKASYFLSDKDCRSTIDTIFKRTIGVYRFRLIQCFNPFYWIFLPKYILENFNINAPQIIISLSNIVFWVVSAFCGYAIEIYFSTHYGDFLQEIMNTLP